MRFRFTLAVLGLTALLRGQNLLTGRIIGDDRTPLPNASIIVRPDTADIPAVSATSDPTGAFSVALPPGDYLISVTRQGFYELKDQRVHVGLNADVSLMLTPIREVFQSIDVSGQPSPVDPTQTSHQQSLTGTQINNIPYPDSYSLRNAMKMIPGVVQDPTGALHFNGAAENQVAFLLNDFNVADPLTGRFNSLLAVEGIRSLDFASGRFSPEYGKGSAGVLEVHTDSGADQFRYTATNFLPGLDTHDGLQVGNWTARFGASGPIEKGHAWFADNFGMEYNPRFIGGLPSGHNRQISWIGSNLAHAQWNITPSNILFVDFLVNMDLGDDVGLGPLDPVSTTTSQRGHQYFTSIKDQFYMGDGILVELGFARNGFYDRRIPQGAGPYVMTPTGRSGNYFVDSTQTTTRDQFLADTFLPKFKLFGEHRFKTGVDLDRLRYSADFSRTAYEYLDSTGRLLSRTTFQGSGIFSRHNAEASTYLIDSWRMRHNLHLDLGLRQDWDGLVRQVALSPRTAFAWSPFASGNTRISGGYAITYDPSNLMLFSQPLDQQSVTAYYDVTGAPSGPPVISSYVINGPLKFPRSKNWSASVDHQLPHRINVSLNYLWRHTSDGFAYEPAPGGVLQLTNFRNDRFHSESVIVKQSLADGFEWMASYTHSSAISNSVFAFNVDQPTQVLNNFGPLAWDVPHRLLGHAYLPLPDFNQKRLKHWAVAALVDYRTGFPFSAANASGIVVGPVNSYRFPDNFDLNLHLERRFVWRHYRFAIRGGFNNLTDHQNPIAVNNVIGSPQFGQFIGNEGRHFVVRIRFFGHANR